jgi:PAS fold
MLMGPDSGSMLEGESQLRWGFLEDDPDACAVVSDRMELVYMNAAAARLVSRAWFGRRCFEIFPTANDLCAFHCPTMTAVHESRAILYCEERLRGHDGPTRELGVAVIPLEGLEAAGERDGARALLLLRPKEEISEHDLLDEARRLLERTRSRFHAVPDRGQR